MKVSIHVGVCGACSNVVQSVMIVTFKCMCSPHEKACHVQTDRQHRSQARFTVVPATVGLAQARPNNYYVNFGKINCTAEVRHIMTIIEDKLFVLDIPESL